MPSPHPVEHLVEIAHANSRIASRAALISRYCFIKGVDRCHGFVVGARRQERESEVSQNTGATAHRSLQQLGHNARFIKYRE